MHNTNNSHQNFALLSWQQMLIWRAPNRKSHIIPPITLRLVGSLDLHALRRAASSLVERHEILRTTFHELPDGEPTRVVHPSFDMPIIETDLRGEKDGQIETQAMEIILAQGSKPYDLESLPLLRIGVIKLGEAEQILWFSIHHIVSDLWSTSILLDELAWMYCRHHDRSGQRLPPLSKQYSDYATWQQDWLERNGAGELAYWRQQLLGLPDLSLPTRARDPSRPKPTGRICSLSLPKLLTSDIRVTALAERTTPFMLLVAVFCVFLRRFASGDAVAFEILSSYRTRSQWEPLIGMLAASSIFRAELAYDQTFRQILAAVRDICFRIYSHSHLTFTKAVELLSQADQPQIYRRPGLLFTLQKTLGTTPNFKGLRVTDLRREGVTLFEGREVDSPLWDQTWQVWDEGSKLQIVVIFKCELYDTEIINRLLSQYQYILELVIKYPGSVIPPP